jgi:hypothetical protein
MCFGVCPAYKLIIHGNGEIFYEGKAFVKEMGSRLAKISPEEVDKLIEEFLKINFFSLEEDYLQARDVSSAITYINLSGREKKVISQGVPKKLNQLNKMIDETVDSAKWIV